MASPYSTVEQFRAEEGAGRALALLDHDQDDIEDAGGAYTGSVSAIAEFIEDSDTDVDARLGAKYVVPFASLTSTPKQVQKLSLYGALAQAYERLAAGGEDAKKWRKRFDDACENYRTGKWVIPSATLLDSDSALAARPFAYESAGTVFAGRVDDDYTDDGVDKSQGL